MPRRRRPGRESVAYDETMWMAIAIEAVAVVAAIVFAVLQAR
jgi:hypothetical protein